MISRNSPRTIALNPSVLCEDEAMQLLTKVLNHVIPFRLAVDQKIETDPFLESDDNLDFLLDELFVLVLGKLSFTKLGAGQTDFFGLLWKER